MAAALDVEGRPTVHSLAKALIAQGWDENAAVTSPCDVVAASRSFSGKIAWGPDGLHARQFQLLSGPLLQGAADMLNLHASAGLASVQAILEWHDGMQGRAFGKFIVVCIGFV